MDEEDAADLANRLIGVARTKANPRSDALLPDRLQKVYVSSGVGEDIHPEISYDGQEILVTAGDRRGFAHYQYRDGTNHRWIHPVLNDWALHHMCYWEWATETSLRLCKWANYDYDADF